MTAEQNAARDEAKKLLRPLLMFLSWLVYAGGLLFSFTTLTACSHLILGTWPDFICTFGGKSCDVSLAIGRYTLLALPLVLAPLCLFKSTKEWAWAYLGMYLYGVVTGALMFAAKIVWGLTPRWLQNLWKRLWSGDWFPKARWFP